MDTISCIRWEQYAWTTAIQSCSEETPLASFSGTDSTKEARIIINLQQAQERKAQGRKDHQAKHTGKTGPIANHI